MQAAVRQQAPASCTAAARGGLAGFSYTIFCTLRAAVRQPAQAGCRAAARGELACSDNTIKTNGSDVFYHRFGSGIPA
jgi:hypothetical protein